MAKSDAAAIIGAVVIMAVALALLVFGVIPGPPDVGAALLPRDISKNLSEVASQLEGAATMLQGIAFGLFVVVGVRYKDSRRSREVLGLFDGICIAGFVFCQFLSAYYAYWIRISLALQLGNAKLNPDQLTTLLAYQGIAVVIAALFSVGMLATGVMRKA